MKQTSFAHMRCSVARTLDQVGPWWSLLIIRDAMMGVRKFKDFERSLGIAKNTLTTRLTELVECGILTRVPPPNGSKFLDYQLTDKGRDLAPVIIALAQWGDRWSAHEDGPSFTFLNRNSGEEIDRIWPRDDVGNPIELTDILLKPRRLQDVEVRTPKPLAGESS